MSKSTGEIRKRSIERGQWSDLDRHRINLHLKGRGEGYLDEVYFGKAFSNPPTFTYSAVFDQEQTQPFGRFMVPPAGSLDREVDSYGIGNHSQSSYGIIQDSGFELQAKYHRIDAAAAARAKQIPLITWWMQGIYDQIDLGYSDQSYIDQWFPLRYTIDASVSGLSNEWAQRYSQPTLAYENTYGPHRWMQTDDVRELWELNLMESHNLGIGEVGQACAEVTLGASGVSNWLIPFSATDIWWRVEMNDYKNAWRMVVSVLEESSDNYFPHLDYGGLQAWEFPPPFIGGFWGFMYAKADSDVTVEVDATFSTNSAHYQVSGVGRVQSARGEKIFDDSAFYYHLPEPEKWFIHRELGNSNMSQKVSAGGWGRVDINLPYDGWRPWPNSYYCLQQKEEPLDGHWTFRFRVKGDPGTTVKFDNIYLDREFRNIDVPMLTVGVDEWIRDEAGAYIGAKVWVTLGSPPIETCVEP